MKHTSPRLNTLAFVLRCLLGRAPTHMEKVRAYRRLYVASSRGAWLGIPHN